ncbi:MAG: AsmA family protein, partial [candidate division KSB1 bacterium]|nr:AsmA family protein [candidate division KSB1 bacterium]
MISQRKKFAWLRKLLKIFLIMGGAFVLILTLGYLIIRMKFPPDKLKDLVAEQLSQALHRRVIIEQASLNPFRGLVLQNFIIYEPEADSLKTEGAKFVSIHKIYLDYTLSSILKRKLVIKEILIDVPEVWLEADREGNWNFSDLIISEVPKDTVLPPPTELKTPLSLSLNQFELKNFSF